MINNLFCFPSYFYLHLLFKGRIFLKYMKEITQNMQIKGLIKIYTIIKSPSRVFNKIPIIYIVIICYYHPIFMNIKISTFTIKIYNNYA